MQTITGANVESCAVMAGLDVSSATSVTLQLSTPSGSQIRAGDARVLAVRVANLSYSSVTG